MSGEFASRRDSHSTKSEWRAQILVKLCFRELCDSKWSGLGTSDDIAISLSSGTNPWTSFFDPHWVLICSNKWHLGISEILIPPEIAVKIHFHMGHGTKTISVFLPVDEKLLVATSKFGLLNIRLYSGIRNTYIFHCLWRGKYQPLFPINKPILSPLWVSPPCSKTTDRKTP